MRFMKVGGAKAGVAAALVSGVALLVAERAGLSGKAAPRKIGEGLLDLLHIRRSDGANAASGVLSHFSYSSACGKFYESAVRGKVFPRHPVAEGMLFGAAVWTSSYFGWVPALGLMKDPTRDRPERTAVTFGANVLYGAVLAKLVA